MASTGRCQCRLRGRRITMETESGTRPSSRSDSSDMSADVDSSDASRRFSEAAFDFQLLVAALRKLKQEKSVKIPVYDFTTHGRHKDWKNVYGASVIIFEGIMSLADKELLQLLDMKIFVDSDIRLVRRLRRDITERRRDIEGVIKQYNKFVKPAFEQFIEPAMRLADIVVPRGDFPAQNKQKHLRVFSFDFSPPQEHGGHRSDRAACSQPAGGGERLYTDCTETVAPPSVGKM
ncbi:hypothetical protein F2P81_010963 [Scophthalmus maximus]|uniref:uridine/cytidine kinase n=1 Tax=Scophthalmus maximus TaxID=52904 RepID=A0A6A4SX99_SCOMX|nr:hypothetical protein F2P81_010963 [Scophthalmus maximus]